ncbi:MAG: LPP20 family lipoprotein [Elusimicrobiota bacterium]|jgi:hypothetical protein|nr:LPP20 family lipoprotein [Elusimicrobiota bacterium]
MKKLTLLLAGAIFITACAGNKNILNEKMAKYPADQYLTKIASAETKKEAKATALTDLQNIFTGLADTKNSKVRREAILTQAKAAGSWKDKNNKKYYAIAALQRQPALDTLAAYYPPIDNQLSAMAKKISGESDKYVRLKYAMAMPPLFEEREYLDSEHRILSFDAANYNEEFFYSVKNLYNKTFYDIKINAKIDGTDDITVKTHLIDALNSMGFAVGEELPTYDIALNIHTKIDKYPSETTKGLYWTRATATISLKDMETGGIFATFSVSERDGSFREAEAQRRSLIAAGDKAVPLIKEKLLDYVQKK